MLALSQLAAAVPQFPLQGQHGTPPVAKEAPNALQQHELPILDVSELGEYTLATGEYIPDPRYTASSASAAASSASAAAASAPSSGAAVSAQHAAPQGAVVLQHSAEASRLFTAPDGTESWNAGEHSGFIAAGIIVIAIPIFITCIFRVIRMMRARQARQAKKAKGDSPEQVPAKALPQQPGAPLPADFQPGPGPPPLPPVTVNNMYLPVDAYTGRKASLSSYSSIGIVADILGCKTRRVGDAVVLTRRHVIKRNLSSPQLASATLSSRAGMAAASSSSRTKRKRDEEVDIWGEVHH